MPLHPEAVKLIDMIRASGAPPIAECTPEQAREIAAGVRVLLGDGPELAEVRDVEIPAGSHHVPARLYHPDACDGTGLIVYFHGGGWVMGALPDSDAPCRKLALESGCTVVSVGYRLAPEHRFPAAPDDCYVALEWIAENLADGAELALLGDSAGGNLAAVSAIRARERGGPAIALQVLVYPVIDHDLTRPSYVEHGDAGYLLGTADMRWFWDHYLPAVEQRDDPDACPLYAEDLSGLPPAIVVLARNDVLFDEGREYARALEAAGNSVDLIVADDQIHGYLTMVNFMQSADSAVADVAGRIRRLVATARR